MLITIPTYGRANYQRTYQNLPKELREKVAFFLQQGDPPPSNNSIHHYMPVAIRDVSATRDYIIDWAAVHEQSVVMLDDDLDFAYRRPDDPCKFLPANNSDLLFSLFRKLERLLEDFAHVSVSPREGANRNPDLYLYNGRMMRILGYQPKVIQHHRIKFAPYTFMCDFGVTLELLTRGYKGVTINSFVQNQPGSDTPGGCSTQRTPETQKQAAEFLAAAFPEYVTVVQKFTKTSWGGGTRHDVRIQWKRAYESSGARRTPEVLDGGAGADTFEEGSGGNEALD